MEIMKAKISQSRFLYDTFLEPYFPEDERKPYVMIESGMKDGRYTVLVLQEQGIICAVAFLLSSPGTKAYLLDYFAVLEGFRNRGYGSMLLAKCIREVDGPILIETESLDTASDENTRNERILRNHFYQKNGASKAGFSANLFRVTYDIWILSKSVIPSKEQLIDDLICIYRSNVSDERMYTQNVIIPSKL